jgi:hypothetical protein
MESTDICELYVKAKYDIKVLHVQTEQQQLLYFLLWNLMKI